MELSFVKVEVWHLCIINGTKLLKAAFHSTFSCRLVWKLGRYYQTMLEQCLFPLGICIFFYLSCRCMYMYMYPVLVLLNWLVGEFKQYFSYVSLACCSWGRYNYWTAFCRQMTYYPLTSCKSPFTCEWHVRSCCPWQQRRYTESTVTVVLAWDPHGGTVEHYSTKYCFFSKTMICW